MLRIAAASPREIVTGFSEFKRKDSANLQSF
jgi:hypothetical protein